MAGSLRVSPSIGSPNEFTRLLGCFFSQPRTSLPATKEGAPSAVELEQAYIGHNISDTLTARGVFARPSDGRRGLVGAHSFIPLLSSFACAIPGITSARTIANPCDHLVTTMIAPMMTYSARLPVYALLFGAFILKREVAVARLAQCTHCLPPTTTPLAR